MITLRPSEARGHADHGWLDTYHTFSFATYYDPRFMGFRALRVINEDRVAPGTGFGTHPHRDMEIITYVLAGALGHQDSMGHGSTIRPGEVQRMTAGSGVTHSEMNASTDEPVHLLQIWILPARRGLEPSYEQTMTAVHREPNRWHVIAAPPGDEGAVTVHQDVRLSAASLEAGRTIPYALPRGRYGWLQVARGRVVLNGQALQAGDGAAIADEEALTVSAADSAEVLLFDMA